MCLFTECREFRVWLKYQTYIKILCFSFDLELQSRFQMATDQWLSISPHTDNLLNVCHCFTASYSPRLGGSGCISSANNREKSIKMNLFLARDDFHSWLKIGQLATLLRLPLRHMSSACVLLLSTPPIGCTRITIVFHISVSRLYIRFSLFRSA